jgi:hypothetical protein
LGCSPPAALNSLMPDISSIISMLTGGGGQGGQIGGQTGSGWAYPVALSGLGMGDQGTGMSGGGQSLSGTQDQGGNKAQSADGGIDPLFLQALLAQSQGGGMGTGLGNLPLLAGVGGGSLGQFGGGVPFGGMGPGQGGAAGPQLGQMAGGASSADPIALTQKLLGAVSLLSRLGGNNTASPTTGTDTGGLSAGAGVSLASPQGADTADTTLTNPSIAGNIVGDLPPDAFANMLASGMSLQQISQFMSGGGGISGGELGLDFSAPSGVAGGTLGQQSGGGGGFNLLGAAGGIQGLVGLGQGISQGDPLSAARGGLGSLQALQGLLFPETTATSIIGNSLATAGIGGAAGAAGAAGGAADAASSAGMAASTLGDFAPYIAPILQSVGTGLNIAQRAQEGIPAGEQAGMGAIDLLTQGIPFLGGSIAQGLDQLFFARYPSKEQRDMMDLARSNTAIRGVLPALEAAGTPEQLTQALWPLFLGRDDPHAAYPLLQGVGDTQYQIGGKSQTLSDQGAMTSLFANASDPNQINFMWQQGVRPEDVNTYNDFLNNSVRSQVGLMRAAQAGDPQAMSLLQAFQGSYADQRRAAQAQANQMYQSQLHPGDTTTQL